MLWRVEDIFTQSLVDWVVDAADPAGLVEDVRQLGGAGEAGRGDGSKAPVLVTTPPFPDFALARPARHPHQRAADRAARSVWWRPSSTVSAMRPSRWSTSTRCSGATASQQAYDTRNDLMYRQPFTSAFARRSAAARRGTEQPDQRRTQGAGGRRRQHLWGGIIGEDGADGVIVGDSFPGNAFRALQHGLAYQAANGALLAMVSKNNDTDVDEIFAARHGDLVLSRQALRH